MSVNVIPHILAGCGFDSIDTIGLFSYGCDNLFSYWLAIIVL